MTCNLFLGYVARRYSVASRTRPRRDRRPLVLEGLDARVLLSGFATLYTVDKTTALDIGSGTSGDLLYVIDQADANTNPAGSVIQFDPSIFNSSSPQTIVLTHPLALTGTAGPIDIDGPGASAVTISGNNTVAVFDIDANVTATLSALTISSGHSSGNGGGILNEGNLTLSDCTVTSNTAVDSGGGIENEGSVTASDCAILNNTAKAATGYGGGIDSSGPLALTLCSIRNNEVSGGNGYGGGIYSTGSASITQTVIDDNSASIGYGGGIYNGGTMNISFSAIAGNSTGASGHGGGIDNENTLTVLYSTIAGNSTGGYGGGIDNDSSFLIGYSTIAANSANAEGGGMYNSSPMEAVNVTIADNLVGSGGGGGGLLTSSTAIELFNTIVAQNNASSSIVPDDIAGMVSSSSTNNLIGTGGAGGLTQGVGGNLVGIASPGLGALAYNGGPTEAIALLPGSPALNAGTNIPSSGTTDQRGPGFVRNFNGGIDIGSYELQPAIVTAVSVDWGSAGTAVLQTAADGLRLLPVGRNTDLPWLGIDELQITFNQPEALTADDVTVSGLTRTRYGPVTITPGPVSQSLTGSSFTYDIFLAHPIEKADRVTITIAGGVVAPYTRRLDVLPGDFNDNGVVSNQDVTAIRNEWKGKNGAQPTIFGEILGDGTVNARDVNAARRRLGTRLPKLGGKAMKAVLARNLAWMVDQAPGPRP